MAQVVLDFQRPDAALYRLLVESVADFAIFIVSPTGHVLTWDLGAERLKGYSADEIIGQHISRFYLAGDEAVPDAMMRTARASGRAEAEGWRKRKDGTRFWASVVLTALHGSDGALRGFAKITRDLSERRSAEMTLQAVLVRQRTLLDASLEATLSVDAEGCVTAFNGPFARAAEAWRGRMPALGEASLAVLPAELGVTWAMDHARTLRGETFENEVPVAVDRGRRYLLVGHSPIVDGGSVVGRTFSIRDVTRTRAAALQSDVLAEVIRLAGRPDTSIDMLCEDALTRMGRYLGWACGHVLRPTGSGGPLASTKIWYGEHDAVLDDLRRISESTTFAAGVGLPGAVLRSKRAVFFADVAREEHCPRWIELARSGLHEAFAFPVLVEDQVVAVLELFAHELVADPTSVLELASLIGSQLSRAVERERSTSALAVAESRLQRVFDSAPAGMALVDVSGRASMANAALVRILGHTREALAEADFRALLRIEVPFEEVRHVTTADGRVIDVELRAADLPTDGRSAPGGAVVHLVDLSERNALDRELKRSNAELEQFAYAASHDLRAPLRAVRSLAGMLEEDLAGKLGADSAEHLSLLRSRVARMEGLLNALLEYARVGRTSEQSGAVDVRKLVDETFALVEMRPGFAVENRCPAITITTTKVALERVLLNLIVNALKHHDGTSGTVTVEAQAAEAFLVFVVRDDGPGIAAEYHERVFQMFQTLRGRDEVEGSGMGLTFVRKIVEQAGGAITLRSEGRGSEFTFTWPREQRS